MNTRRRTEPTSAKVEPLSLWQGMLLAAVTALFVARPLVTSDASAQEGDEAMFVMLWILLAGAWLLSCVRRGRLVIRFGWTEAAVVLLVAWHSFAALVGAGQGSPRPAINLLWQWIGLGLAFLLARQLFVASAQIRAALATMLAVAVALAAIGLQQYFVTVPQTRVLYEQIKDDPEQMLREVGEWYPPGSAERLRFENRLYSSEPTGTFALANSLAGLLTPWLILAVGIGVLPQPQGKSPLRAWGVALLLAVPLASCLLLTKSRSAFAGVLVGMVLLWLVSRAAQGILRRRRLVLAIFGMVALTVVAFASGMLDRQVISEAGKSLGYRAQYWRSTLGMIADDPLFGVGPGQFQDRYTAHKLAAASEEIQDPHNFLLEVWATAGTPALGLLVTMLVMFSFRALAAKQAVKPTSDQPSGTIWIFGGAMGGVFVARAIGMLFGYPLDFDTLIVAAAVVGVVLFLLRDWVRHGLVTPGLIWAAAVALLVNLLAAGGINYAGVAGSLWLLIALGLSLAAGPKPPRGYSVEAAWIWTATAALLAAANYVTFYRPVLGCQSLISQSFATEALRDPVGRERLLVAAAAIDPYSAEAAQLLASQRFALWQQDPTPQRLAEFDAAAAEARRLDPNSSALWAQCGAWYQTVAQTTGNASQLQLAAQYLQQAVTLYPTSAATHAALAQVLLDLGETAAAQTAAREALRLDDITRAAGHLDRQLRDELRTDLLRISQQPEF